MFAYFDIGGTKTRVAVSRDGITFDEPAKFDTPAEFGVGVDAIVHAIHDKAGGEPLHVAAGGVPGPLNENHSTLVNAPNLPGWVGKPIQDELSVRLGAPVVLENDSAVVGLGEARYGAGRGYAIVAYLTVSTGVGGARIVDGHIDRSAHGFEPGHQIMDADRTVFPALAADEAEEIVSGTATARRFNKKAYEVKDPAAWEELARLLAYMVNDVAVFWSPHVVVLGGSMIVGDPAIPLDRTEEYFKEVCTIFKELPVLRRAELRDVGGLYGAMALANDHLVSAGEPPKK